MSLAICINNVAAVLLADGWHQVEGATFDLDAYEYVDAAGELVLGGGQTEGVPSTGAVWRESGGMIVACPLTAVLAVKWRGI